MIPYLELPSFQLPLIGTLHPYGIMVGLGAVAAFWVMFLRARQAGIPDPAINSSISWSVAAALIGAHLAYLALSGGGGGRLAEIGVPRILRIWDGTSSVGGIAGAFLGFWWSTRHRKGLRAPILSVLVQGTVAGWVFGRLGCTLAHDHPGRFSEFFLAVRYPEGSRHDLGFYEFLFSAFVLLPLTLVLARLRVLPLVLVGAVSAEYGIFRFLIGFLRVPDEHAAGGLAAGQLMAIVLVLAGVVLIAASTRRQGLRLR